MHRSRVTVVGVVRKAVVLVGLVVGSSAPLTAATCPDGWLVGPNPTGLGLLMAALVFQGHTFTPTSAFKSPTDPWVDGIIAKATYRLSPDPVPASPLERTWDASVGMYKKPTWSNPKVFVTCYVLTGNTWFLSPGETSGSLGWVWEPPQEECQQFTGCEGQGGGGGNGNGGGSGTVGPATRCIWERYYVVETGEVLSVTFLGCFPI